MELSPAQAADYLQRIGLTPGITLDLNGLASVQDAHIRAIPFENFDLLMGRGVSVEPGDIFERLVTDRRGGYCFTTNTLLDAGLRHLGFGTWASTPACIWDGSSSARPALRPPGCTPWSSSASTIKPTSWTRASVPTRPGV